MSPQISERHPLCGSLAPSCNTGTENFGLKQLPREKNHCGTSVVGSVGGKAGETLGGSTQPVGVAVELGEAVGLALLVVVSVRVRDGLRVSPLVAVPGKRRWGWGKHGASQQTALIYGNSAIDRGRRKRTVEARKMQVSQASEPMTVLLFLPDLPLAWHKTPRHHHPC